MNSNPNAPQVPADSDSPTAAAGPIQILPHRAPVLRAFGQELTVLLSGEQTGGLFTLLLDTTPPGLGTPPHQHEREDEWFYVLEGRAAFWRAGDWRELPPGSAVFAPRNVPHGFKNIGDTPLRLLITLSPSGFETWFARCAREFSNGRAPDFARIASLIAEHGMSFVEQTAGGSHLAE